MHARHDACGVGKRTGAKAGKLYNSGTVEGINLRINLCMRKAYGYRSFDLLQTSLFHTLGELPEPEFTHKFC